MAEVVCARIGCTKSADSKIAMSSMDAGLKKSLYDCSKSDKVCAHHYEQHNNLFPTASNGLFRYDYNLEEKCIDYYSTAKMSNRAPLRVISFRSTDEDDKFELVNMLLNGNPAPAPWKNELTNKFQDFELRDYNTSSVENEVMSTPKVKYSAPMETDITTTPSLSKEVSTDSETMMSYLKTNPMYSSNVVASMRDLFFIKEYSDKMQISVPSFSRGRSVSTTSFNSMLPTPVILISIEGNIGAGKSTILNKLKKKHPHWNYIDEPLDTWTSLKNDDGTNLLECFYADQRRWSYTFQNCAVLSRFRNIEQAIEDKLNSSDLKSNIFITERCLDTDYHVFAKMLNDDKMIDSMEFSLYKRWFNLLKETATPLSAVVLIDTPPAVCDERIKGRSRSGESGIPLPYLEKLTEFQNNWINTLCDDENNRDISNAYSSMSESKFPCVRATTIETIEEFISGLQLASYNDTHLGGNNSTRVSPLTTKMNLSNISDNSANENLISVIDTRDSNSPTNVQ